MNKKRLLKYLVLVSFISCVVWGAGTRYTMQEIMNMVFVEATNSLRVSAPALTINQLTAQAIYSGSGNSQTFGNASGEMVKVSYATSNTEARSSVTGVSTYQFAGGLKATSLNLQGGSAYINGIRNYSGNGEGVTFNNGDTFTNSNANAADGFQIKATVTWNQTEGASSTDLLLNRVDTALGTGSHNFIDCRVSNVSKFQVSNGGEVRGSTFSPQHALSLASRLNALLVAGSCTPKLTWFPMGTGVADSTSVDLSNNANTLTYKNTAVGSMGYKGFLKAYTFDGTDDYLTAADSDSLSFGNGSVDVPFYVWAVINVVNDANTKRISGKYAGGQREYYFNLLTNETISVLQYDQSATKACSRTTDAALSIGPHLVVYTNSGTGGATAMATGLIYVDGRLVASTASEDAGYVSMENGTSIFNIGATDAPADFFPSSMYGAGVGLGAPSAVTIWNMWLDIAGELNLTVS